MKFWVPPLAAVILAIVAAYATFHLMPKQLPQLSREQFLNEARMGHIRKVVIEDQEAITGSSSTLGPFRTRYDPVADEDLVSQLSAMGVEVFFSESTPGLI